MGLLQAKTVNPLNKQLARCRPGAKNTVPWGENQVQYRGNRAEKRKGKKKE